MECREKRDCRLRIVDFGFLIGKRKSGRRSGRSKINNQQSEIRNQKSEIRNQKSSKRGIGRA
jgi:hypothetical protein